MELVGGDDHGQNTAVNDEMHAVFFILRVHVHVDSFLENRILNQYKLEYGMFKFVKFLLST